MSRLRPAVRAHLFALIPALCLMLAVSTAGAFTPSGLLEIHHINVQQGDCTLIIGPDGTTLLIDAGNNGKGSAEVIPYMQSLGLMPVDGLDYMLATHRDADHLGGLDDVINAGYDVRNNVWDNGSTKTNITINDFLAAAATTTAGAVTQIPLNTVIQLGGGATARCVAVNGDVLGHGMVPGATANENDMSVAILVQYGGFDYITAGDLGGGDDDNACTFRSTSQVNVETPLANSIMPGGGASLLTLDGVEVLDVNHHGSESSTNSEFMNALTPGVAVINVGAGQGGTFHHPRIDVVEKVLLAQAACVTASPALVLQTEEGSPTGSNTSFSGYCSGDVFITTDGVSTYTVDGTGAVSQGPDERAAAGLPRVIGFDGAGGDTEAPMVTVFTPDGGESWDAGTMQNITWVATDNVGVTSIDLLYSTTGAGGPFTAIATGEANDGTYVWTVPDAPSTDAYVQVVAYDAASNSGQDVSNAAFTILGSGQPQLVINEIMQNPNAVSDTDGEWFEIYNPGAVAVDINGWTIRDDGADSHLIQNGAPLNVPAGGYLVLGRSGNTGTNGGYVPDYVYSGFNLANADDEVILENGGVIVDRVDYTGSSPWPNPTGTSMELIDAGTDNNVGGNWSEAIARGGTFTGGGDLGTPGAQNSVSTGGTPPTAAFAGTPTSGTAPLMVSFTDQSTGGPTSWSWDFGDGVGTSTEQNPGYTYTAAGTYTVSLTATNASGFDVETKVDYITVSDPPVSSTMHVSSIVVSRISGGPGGAKKGQAVVTILDDNDQPVDGATVTGDFSGVISETGANGTTNASGQTTIETAGTTQGGGGDICFAVTSVAHASLSYDPGSNNVTQSCQKAGDIPMSIRAFATIGLGQNRPNPFKRATEIRFSLARSSQVTLGVYDVTGRQVAVLASGTYPAGQHSVIWNATRFPAGTYFYRLSSSEFTEIKRMIHLK